MRRFVFLWLAVCSTACDGPSPTMRGAISRTVTVEGSTFTVHQLGDRAEAVRTNFEYRAGIMARGHTAIELATGCRIVRGSYTGDAAMMKARLSC